MVTDWLVVPAVLIGFSLMHAVVAVHFYRSQKPLKPSRGGDLFVMVIRLVLIWLLWVAWGTGNVEYAWLYTCVVAVRYILGLTQIQNPPQEATVTAQYVWYSVVWVIFEVACVLLLYFG